MIPEANVANIAVVRFSVPVMLPTPKALPPMALFAVAIIFLTMQRLFVRQIFPSGELVHLRLATGGLIAPTLIANLSISLATIGTLTLVWKQKPVDLGLYGRIGVAAMVTLAVWMGINVVEAIAGWMEGGLMADPAWTTRPLTIIGQWIGTTFGTALLEEVLFRGVLLRQLVLRLTHSGVVRWASIVTAITLSQIAFAAMHLPETTGLDAATVITTMIGLFIAGVALALLYVVTGNLLLCIGLHGLADAPSLLIVDHWELLDNQRFIVASCILIGTAALLIHDGNGRFPVVRSE